MLLSYYMSIPDLSLERQLWNQGYKYIAGVDEAGRGPWAGPVVAGAAIFAVGCIEKLPLKDSKQMTEAQREEVFELIKEQALGWGVGIVAAHEIDKHGISTAVQSAMARSIEAAEEVACITADYLLIDGKSVREIVGYKQQRMNKGDTLHYSISAGAILAKVTRDRMMVELSNKYPQYGFEKHKGYGTKIHQEALDLYGPCAIHRYTYKPVAKAQEAYEKRSRK